MERIRGTVTSLGVSTSSKIIIIVLDNDKEIYTYDEFLEKYDIAVGDNLVLFQGHDGNLKCMKVVV